MTSIPSYFSINHYIKLSMRNNILSLFLKELKVKNTNSFSETLFEEHPYKYSLYGLSKMLSVYQIPNAGFKLREKNISRLTPPFIAHIGSDFVIVRKIDSKSIDYIWKGEQSHSPIETFNEVWSGVVLVAEPDEQSTEPDYKRHRTKEILRIIQRSILWLLLSAGVLLLCIHQNITHSFGLCALFVTNLAGLYISYLLLLKQSHTESEYADKICSLFHQTDCSNILESDAAKIGGVLSWSEVGLGYFISNITLLICYPSLISYLSIINICALPYTLWSVWYQYKIAKQWCVLCLLVQLLLWVLFTINISTGLIQQPDFLISHLFAVCIIYACPPLLINLLTSTITKANKLQSVTQELNSIKNTDEVFLAILKKQPYHTVDHSTSQIIFGNRKARLGITILTNPHCEPCAKMHKRVNKLLETAGDKLYVQYVFTSFNDSLQDSNRFLIGTYLHSGEKAAMKIYDDWFEKNKYKSKEVFEKAEFELNATDINAETEEHKKWKTENHLTATPTILINGYQLSDKYKIEDLVSFTDIDIH